MKWIIGLACFLSSVCFADNDYFMRTMSSYRELLCESQNRLVNAYRNSFTEKHIGQPDDSVLAYIDEKLAGMRTAKCPAEIKESKVVDYLAAIKKECDSLCDREPQVKARSLLKGCHTACAVSADGDKYRFQGFLEGVSAMKNIDCGHASEPASSKSSAP
jgi:hypothetical protein